MPALNHLSTDGHARGPQVGFSLIEILVAVVVLSIGLLGLAGLQFTALRGNNQSYERSQAQVLAYDIADAMRANRVAAGQGRFEIAKGRAPTNPSLDCTSDACTRDETADYTRYQWYERVAQSLRSGQATIECSVTPCRIGAMQTVSVMWDEERNNATDFTCPEPGRESPSNPAAACVRLSFSP